MLRFVIPALSLLLISTLPSVSLAKDQRDVVREDDGAPVLNTFGNCVRTDWMGEDTVCDGRTQIVQQEAPRTIVRPSPARQLEREARTVYFDFNKSNIRDSERPKLDTLADVLKSDADVVSASIVGYADRIGNTKYNERLSQRRAKSVEHYLKQRGYLNTSVAEVRWFGETEPVTNCPDHLKRKDLIACLAKDRRVEVEIQFKSDMTDTKPHKTMDHTTSQP